MANQVKEWKHALTNPLILFWLAVWVLASFMLYKQWKSGSPWPAGAFMPF